MIELKFSRAVLFKNAVATLAGIAEEVTINFTPEELSVVALDPFGFVKAALRMKSSAFETFICDENSSARINLGLLNRKLRLASDEDSITITDGDEEMEMGIMFQNERAGESWYSNIDLTQVNNENVDINEFQNEYEAVVGITSEDLSDIINHLSNFGPRVTTEITDTEVRFSVENEELFISTENDACIIGGVAEHDTVHLLFTLYEMQSLLNASVLSSSVWIFQSETLNCLMNFPVAAVGNIMFYYF